MLKVEWFQLSSTGLNVTVIGRWSIPRAHMKVAGMCESDKVRGFFIATGFSGHGFGIGPGAGKACAGMLTSTDSGIDLSEFQLRRFLDGSPIQPYGII